MDDRQREWLREKLDMLITAARGEHWQKVTEVKMMILLRVEGWVEGEGS
jgi:hypothetical protein